MYAGQEVNSGNPGCLLAVPGDQKMEGGGDSAVEVLFSSFLPPPHSPPSPKKSPGSPTTWENGSDPVSGSRAFYGPFQPGVVKLPVT